MAPLLGTLLCFMDKDMVIVELSRSDWNWVLEALTIARRVSGERSERRRTTVAIAQALNVEPPSLPSWGYSSDDSSVPPITPRRTQAEWEAIFEADDEYVARAAANRDPEDVMLSRLENMEPWERDWETDC